MRPAKVRGTLTPTNVYQLAAFREAGLDGGRLQERFFRSVNGVERFVKKIDQIDPDFPLLIDLPGAKARLVEILNGPDWNAKIQEGSEFLLLLEPKDPEKLARNFPLPLLVPSHFPEAVPPKLFFADGEAQAQLINAAEGVGRYRVTYGSAELRDGSGVHFGSVKVQASDGLTDEDRRRLAELYGNSHLRKRIESVALSFVRSPREIYEAHEVALHWGKVAKIEDMRGARNLRAILRALKEVGGALALAEGDGFLAFQEKLPDVRRFVAEEARAQGVPFYIWTVLRSMSKRPFPSAEDVISFRQAIDLGAEEVLISDPLRGPYAVEAVRWAARLRSRREK